MTRDPASAALPASAPHFLTLVAMTALATLSLNMILPSLPAIAAEMEASYGTVNLMIGGYLAMTALVQIVAGPVSDRIGRRPVVLTALGVFILASALCLVATDIRLLIAARFLQAAVIACSAMSLAIIRDTGTSGQAAARMARLSMAMAVAPMIAPILGGALEQALGCGRGLPPIPPPDSGFWRRSGAIWAKPAPVATADSRPWRAIWPASLGSPGSGALPYVRCFRSGPSTSF